MAVKSARMVAATVLVMVGIMAVLIIAACGPLAVSRTQENKPRAPVELSSADPLAALPLHLGNTWVYSSTHYLTADCGPDGIPPTFIITDTVAGVQTEPYFAAQITREKKLLAGDDVLPPGATDGLETTWYVISGTHVYAQRDPLDLAHLEARSRLEYVFPLESGGRWYPDDEKRARFPEFEYSSELRRVGGPVAASVPAGDFAGCFSITEVTAGYTTVTWFCPGVGIVERAAANTSGTLGYKDVLLRYGEPGKTE